MKIWLLFYLVAFSAFSQEFKHSPETFERPDPKVLEKINENILWLEESISKKRESVNQDYSFDVKKNVETELQDLIQRHRNMKIYFLESATKVELKKETDIYEIESRDLLKELQDLLGPIVSGIRRISARPRKIEKLRFEIFNIKGSLETQHEAINRIDILLKDQNYKQLWPEINDAKDFLTSKIQELSYELGVREKSLMSEMGEKKTLWEEAGTFLGAFFKTRGKHLLFSILTLVFIFWFLSFFRERFFKIPIFTNKLRFLTKPLKTLYFIISFALAFLGAVLALYVLNDWVLVTVFIVLMMAFIWSLKQFLPRMVGQARHIFNLGPVRENERLIWNGIPWRVVNLGFYSTVTNEALDGGSIKISAQELLKYHSRPIPEDEPWFPTSKGDWVMVNGVYGKIKLQTPEQVVVEMIGGKLIYYQTSAFLSLNPENFSKGYAIEKFLGLDYGIQRDVASGVLENFKIAFECELKTDISIKNEIIKLEVAFHSCGESSLNIWVRLCVSGNLADKKLFLERRIEEIFLNTCNKHNYKIPFRQLSVHIEK